MKMSDVKFNVKETEGSENINPTMTFIGRESIAAIHHVGHTYDKLVEALDTIIAVMDNIQDSEGLNVKEIYALLEAKETLKQTKESGQ